MIFTIKGELTDLNRYIKALNASRWGGNDIKQTETYRVAVEARAARLQPVTEYPIRIIYRWYSKDQRMDVDNVAFAKKFINDGLVQAGVIENDTRRYIAGFTDEFFIDKNNPRVEVELSTVRINTNTK
jgi:hypothetical protein